VLKAIDDGLKPFKKLLKREVTEDDLVRLTEIKIKRISKFNAFEADEHILSLEKDIDQTQKHLKRLTAYTIKHFERLMETYGKNRQRRTTVANFERVAAADVAIANETLYLDEREGFAGYGLKKGEGNPIGKCSTMDEVLFITREGNMTVAKVTPKFHVGKNPCHVDIFKRDEQAVYAMIYRDGKGGRVYAKRFRVGGVTRDKEYPLASEAAGTRVLWFKRFETEEESNAQKVTVHLKHEPRMKQHEIIYDWSELAIKGRDSKGNIVTERTVDRVTMV
jgi:topoisomerase-4 subunit A